MKNNLLVLSLLSILLICERAMAQNPIPNYSFENWSAGEPVGWLTSNGFATFVTQVSPGHSGSSAVRGDVQTFYGFNAPPQLYSTDLSGSGFPVSQDYSNFYFYYKFNQVGTANLTVAVDFYNAQDSIIGYAIDLIATSATSFTLGSAPIIMSGTPASCVISITIIDPNAAYGLADLGNYFIVDDLSFDNSIGVPSVANSTYFINAPIPNPAATSTTISYALPKSTDVDLKIYDLFGRQLKVVHAANTTAGENILNLDVNDLSDGAYLIVLTSEFGILQRRLVVSK